VKIIIYIIVVLICASFALAQTGNISGFVFDDTNGESLIGANIYLQNTAFGSVTNTAGYFIISDLPAGTYTVVSNYIGFKDYIEEVELRAGESLKLYISLKAQLMESETITITADSVRTALQLFRKDISQIVISPMEIRQVPAVAETDLLRTLQSMPGILPISDYSSEIYVRGGTSDQNLYLVDGADVYNPEHAFGLFSTFNTDAIKDIEISKGGFGANYGGRLSSVLNVTNLDGNRKSFEGTAEVSLLTAKTTLQFPLGKIGNFSASYRRTYVGETAKLFYDDVPDYYFYDGHVKAFFDINSDNKLSMSVYNGKDDLDYDFNSDAEDAPTLHYDWGNTTASLRWTHIFTPTFFSNFWLTVSDFASRFELTEANVEETNDLLDYSIKGQFEYALSQQLNTRFGFELKNINTVLQQNSPGGIIDINRDRGLLTGYFSLNWSPSSNWFIEPGVRYINLKVSTGIYYQYLYKVPRPFIADIWTSADQNYDRSKSSHYVLGFQKEIVDNIALEAEVYYKDYKNLYTLKNYFLDFEPTSYDAFGRPIYTETEGLFDRGDGNSLGFELLLRKRYGIVNGWVAYTLARTQYVVDGINQEDDFEPRHDRTHVINAVMNFDIKNGLRSLRGEGYKNDRAKWMFGMNFVYTSGQPITLTSSTYASSSLPDQDFNQLFLYPSTINAFRLPAYARLDLSLTYEHYYDGWSMAPYIQIYNIGNRENVWFIQYESEEKENQIVQEVDTFNMFPLLPTFGIRFRF
jgi:hypothetical protein